MSGTLQSGGVIKHVSRAGSWSSVPWGPQGCNADAHLEFLSYLHSGVGEEVEVTGWFCWSLVEGCSGDMKSLAATQADWYTLSGSGLLHTQVRVD